MFYRSKWIVAVAIVFDLVVFIPVVQAEQQNFDITFCGSIKTTETLLESQDLIITTFEGKGIVRSNLKDKTFDNWSYHLLGVRQEIPDKSTAFGYSKYMDPDGDIVVQENLYPLGAKESTWKFLYGTGKWKGIKGSGKTAGVTRAKPITPGTRQGCLRSTGKFELPK
jgi:hypothetical protein